MTSKESCPVWGGAVGKVPYQRQLAGRLLYAYRSVYQPHFAREGFG
jgi:hypothetical protein